MSKFPIPSLILPTSTQRTRRSSSLSFARSPISLTPLTTLTSDDSRGGGNEGRDYPEGRHAGGERYTDGDRTDGIHSTKRNQADGNYDTEHYSDVDIGGIDETVPLRSLPTSPISPRTPRSSQFQVASGAPRDAANPYNLQPPTHTHHTPSLSGDSTRYDPTLHPRISLSHRVADHLRDIEVEVDPESLREVRQGHGSENALSPVDSRSHGSGDHGHSEVNQGDGSAYTDRDRYTDRNGIGEVSTDPRASISSSNHPSLSLSLSHSNKQSFERPLGRELGLMALSFVVLVSLAAVAAAATLFDWVL